MAITYADLKAEKVPLPPSTPRNAPKSNRVTFADILRDLAVNDSFWLADKNKRNVDSQVFAAKRTGKLSGKFKVVEYGLGGDSVHPDEAGVRVWRLESGDNVTKLQAAE